MAKVKTSLLLGSVNVIEASVQRHLWLIFNWLNVSCCVPWICSACCSKRFSRFKTSQCKSSVFGKLIKWDFGKLGLVVKEEVGRGDVLLLFYDRQETWGNLTLEKLLLSLGVTFHQCFGLENVFIWNHRRQWTHFLKR